MFFLSPLFCFLLSNRFIVYIRLNGRPAGESRLNGRIEWTNATCALRLIKHIECVRETVVECNMRCCLYEKWSKHAAVLHTTTE